MLGTGTKTNPYIIQTPADLNAIRNKLGTSIFYELGNDIDMSGWGNFTPIGGTSSSTRFKCSLDGKGFKIKNLTISTSSAYTGFIVMMDGSTAIVKDISFINADVSTTNNTVGVVCGANISSSIISGVYVSGKVKGQNNVSSISGVNGAIIENCYSDALLDGIDQVSGIARLDSVLSARIFTSYFNGSIVGNPTNKFGIAGGTISESKVSNNYYNMDTTGFNTSDMYGYGLTDAQMKDGSSFVGFNSDIWQFDNSKYPYLKILGEPPTAVKKSSVNVGSHVNVITGILEKSKRKLYLTVSHIDGFGSTVQTNKSIFEQVASEIDAIVSNIQTLKNAQLEEVNLISSLDEIGSNVTTIKSRLINLGSHIEPIMANLTIEFIKDVQDTPIYATVGILTNPSLTGNKQNMSMIRFKQNQTTTSIK